MEEEVITTGIDADFSEYMSDHKHGVLPGIDLSDPQQLTSLAKYVTSMLWLFSSSSISLNLRKHTIYNCALHMNYKIK